MGICNSHLKPASEVTSSKFSRTFLHIYFEVLPYRVSYSKDGWAFKNTSDQGTEVEDLRLVWKKRSMFSSQACLAAASPLLRR